MRGRLKKETVVSDLHPQIFPLSYLFYSVLQGLLWAVCCSLKEQPLQRLRAQCILPPASILFTEPCGWQQICMCPRACWYKPGWFEEGSGQAWGAHRGVGEHTCLQNSPQKSLHHPIVLLTFFHPHHARAGICHRFLSPRRETPIEPALLLGSPFLVLKCLHGNRAWSG